MDARSKAWVRASHFLGMRIAIPPGARMSVSCECCVLSGRGLYDRPITRPEESYRLCVSGHDLGASTIRRHWPL